MGPFKTEFGSDLIIYKLLTTCLTVELVLDTLKLIGCCFGRCNKGAYALNIITC